jgi:predicted nucleotidyltransferase
MDVSRPYSAVAPTVEGDVLVALAGSARAMSGRQVARLVRRGSQPAVNAALERLTAQGVVLREEAPPAYLYELNRAHVGAPAVLALAEMRSEFLRRLRYLLAHWPVPAVHASMFGSAARGDGDSESDIDLFIVRPRGLPDDDQRWAKQISELSEAVRTWTGNKASIVEFPQERLAVLREQSPSALSGLRADAVPLSGPPFHEFLGGQGHGRRAAR